MIGISKLYCGTVEPSDPLRYGRQSGKLPSHLLQFSADKKPVVVWNCTKQCNLRCVHCYATATGRPAPDELTGDEARAMIDDLGAFGAPVMLFSGGEPLMRGDLLELIAHAKAAGMRAVVSTNGTLITPEKAARFAEVGLSYAGVSLDGLEEVHDRFRGVKGSFRQALEGIRNCMAAGVKVGLRFTLNKRNVDDLPGIFDLIERENIPRVCFYHLVYTGRGGSLMAATLSNEKTRATVDLIMARTRAMHEAGRKVEVLTVDNHCDGPYVYLRMLRENADRAAACLELLKMNGGNSAGVGIGCVSWNGDVLPDQFWRHHVLGNVRQTPFSAIWADPDQPLLSKLRDRKGVLKCRCMHCRWLSCCNGNFRARAEAVSGDLWGDDPACYLSDEEIALP
ncbi:MAG TPA: 12,18-didecarboxysiroheme deacetylase [Phycisphaerae bacterium]|nr:12,18-didecarboxysiroheme deacetylase [Phycisphaerae bacterium]